MGRIKLYRSQGEPCGYFSDQTSHSLFVSPDYQPDQHEASGLSELGFRRSGTLQYRPDCDGCNRCIPIRLPVNQFQSKRRFRRITRKNTQLTVSAHNPTYSEERYNLYRRYINSRHSSGSMGNPTVNDFERFLCINTGYTQFVEFRDGDTLVCVTVIDQFIQGLSAVYTFFEPQLSHLSLGVYAVLWQIDEAKRQELPFLYLGYLIHDSPKMSYKEEFQPLEAFSEQQWQPLPLHNSPLSAKE